MAKNKKSKILAMALCASVMTGIYASPVMAAAITVSDTSILEVSGNVGNKYTITSGTLNLDGDGIASALNDKDIVANSITVNKINGIDVVSNGTALTIGKVTLDKGHINASSALFNSDDGKVRIKNGDVVTLDSDGTTEKYSLNTVGKNTSGISRAGTTDENRSTYIEETVRVNNNSGLVVYAEDGITFAAQIDREGNVLTEGVGRFGALEGPNVRMENGVLTVNSTGETDVAKLDARGLTLTSGSGATEATLSAEQIARLNTVVTQNGESIVVTADHFKNTNESFAVDSNGAVRAADGKFKVGADGAVRAANGRFKVGADGKVAIQYAGDGAIVADNNGFAVQKGSAQAVVTNDGVGLAAGLKADGSAAARISVTDDGIGLQGGTSEVVLNSNNGAVFTNGEGNGETVINGGSITTGTVNGVAIGMNGDCDITLGDDIVFDDKFNSGNVAGITRKPPLDDSAPGGSNTTFIEQNTAISADGIVVKDPGSGVSTKTKYNGFYVKDEYGNNVSSLKNDGLRLTDAQSGRQILNATDIADIKGIDRSGDDTDGYTTTIEDVTSFTKYGMVTSNITTDNITTGSFTAGVTEDSIYHINEEGEMLFRSGGNYIGMNRDGIGFTSGTESVTINGDGTTFTSGDSTTRTTTSTVIKGGTITTKTLNVDKIVLGDKIVDKDTGDVIGGELEIGADGSIKIADKFEVDTDNLAAHYGRTSLNMNSDGFNLNNGTGENAASLVLNGSGFAFAGPVNLGAASDVKFGYTGNLGGYTESSYSLSQLVDTVNDIYDRTSGIYKDAEGNTVVTDGTWNAESKEMEDANSSITVGEGGATFESTTNEGATNINGSEIVSDATNVESGSGSGSGFGGGTSTTNGDNAVYEGVDGDYTHVSSDGVTIGDITNTNTTNIDKEGMVVDGSTGTTHISDSGMTVTGENGTNNISDSGMTITGKDGNTTTTNNISDKGMTVTGSNGTTNISGGDISVDNSVTVAGGSENKTTINNEGITVGDKGTSIKNDSISVGDGGYIGDGDVRSGEGVSLNDTAERVGHLENRVGKLEDRVDKVGAMAAAIANLRTMGYDPAAPTEVAVGIGQYRDETGAALGLFHYPNRDFMLSLSVSTSGDEVMGGIGATWKFGRKSPEKVAEIKKAQAEADARRAEEAKLAKAEEMKQAAKEAKIKAQQERHAKLAAQAEAAK